MELPTYNGDILEYISTLVSNIDTRTWLIIAGVVIGLAILKIIISGVKKAILIIAVAAVVSTAGAVAYDVTNAIGIEVKDNMVYLSNSSYPDSQVALSDVKRIELRKEGYTVITLVTESAGNVEIRIDAKYYEPAKVVLARLPIELKVTDAPATKPAAQQ